MGSRAQFRAGGVLGSSAHRRPAAAQDPSQFPSRSCRCGEVRQRSSGVAKQG